MALLFRRAPANAEANLRYPATRNAFLGACLTATDRVPAEHLIVGYGFKAGSTTDIDKIDHAVGETQRVTISERIALNIRRHHFHRSDAEVIVFHNHPRTGEEPVWFHAIKAIIRDLPIASSADRHQLEIHALNPVGLARQLMGQGRVRFFLGESGYVKEFQIPRLLPWLDRLAASRGPDGLRQAVF